MIVECKEGEVKILERKGQPLLKGHDPIKEKEDFLQPSLLESYKGRKKISQVGSRSLLLSLYILFIKKKKRYIPSIFIARSFVLTQFGSNTSY